MAKRTEESTKLAVKVKLENPETGKTSYSQRVFAHINPQLTDEDAFSIGTKLGALQAHEVAGLNRTDAAGLTE